MKLNFLPFAAVLGALVPSANAFDALPPQGFFGIPLQLNARSTVDFLDSSSEGPSGQIWHSRVRLPLFLPISEGTFLLGAVSGGYTDYEYAPFASGGVQTWDWSGLAALNLKLTEEWDGLLGGLGSFGYEDGAGTGDSFSGGGFIGASYRWSKTLRTSFGAIYLTRLEDDSMVVPFVNIHWKISDQLNFQIQGLESRLDYKVADAWTVFARAEFDPAGARLKDRKDLDITSFSDRALRFGLGVEWEPSEAFTLSLDGGISHHTLTIYENGGRELSDGSPDIAPYIGVSAKFQF